MAAGLRERAFEPFFTTKGEGKGAGLGLATVHGIVTQSGGFVRLLSEVGQGTRVEMLFPCLTPASQTPAPGEPVHPRLSGSETLLLVEDEEGVREVVARSLRRAGYRVLVAADGPEAVALAESREPIALMVCDVVMPEMDGRQVVEAVRHERPGLKALFVSGYSSDVIATRGLLDPGVELLGKPFAASALLDRIRALLDS
jgi:CheY-like chemotaxis protein